jgi:hypothetical protein
MRDLTAPQRPICGHERSFHNRALRIAIQRVGGLLELDTVKEPLNVAGDRVRGHDKGRVKRMDVLLVTEPLA